jgi:formylglycine-generating enzyme required for sulfatase activity
VGQFKAFARAATYRTDAEKDGWAVAWTGSSWGKVDDASWQKPGFEQTEDHPVTEVSWNDGKAFCEWMSKAGTAKVSLPSEAQWEYACRAGSKGRFFWGEEETKAGQYANVADKTGKAKFSNWTIFDTDDGYVFTSPVGKFRANDFGLYDMTGNVWEWCEDTYGDYDKAPTDGTSARNDANDASRVLRGGSWDVNPQDARSACRYRGRPDDRNFLAGFRVVVACEWLR